MAAWVTFHRGPQTWQCDDCKRHRDLWQLRGQCEFVPSPSVGAERGQISAEVAVHVDAPHLGAFSRCPMAEVIANQRWIDRVFTAYSMLRRFSVMDDEIDRGYLIALDDEVRRIEAIEREETRRREEAQRKAQQQRR